MIPHAARAELRDLLGAEGLAEDEVERACHAYDATPFSPEGTGRVLPDAVAFPESAEQVGAIVDLARRHGFVLVPRGGGTGMTGGSRPVRGGLVLTFPRMARITIDERDLCAVVQPGAVTGRLQAEAEQRGLFYPPDPASKDFCTIGGNLAENAGGLRAVKYGVTRDWVLGLDAVLGDGTRLTTGSRAVKSVVGYDMTRLLVGSEGTLGVITEARLKLIPLPETRATLAASFDDVRSAADSVLGLLTARLDPTALELIDRTCLESVRETLPFPLIDRTRALLLVELDGGASDVARRLPAAERLCREHGATASESAADEAGREALWQARRSISPALGRISPHKVDEDVAVPRSRLAELVAGVQDIAARHDLQCASYGHAGDGNLHVNLLLGERQPEVLARAERAVSEIFDLALQLGGTLSGEHGIGTAKRIYVARELGAAGIAAARRIKAAFDPDGILNPGKVLPEPGAGESGDGDDAE